MTTVESREGVAVTKIHYCIHTTNLLNIKDYLISSITI